MRTASSLLLASLAVGRWVCATVLAQLCHAGDTLVPSWWHNCAKPLTLMFYGNGKIICLLVMIINVFIYLLEKRYKTDMGQYTFLYFIDARFMLFAIKLYNKN